MNWETYIAFGDSITIGARSYLGYPERVGDILSGELSKQWNVINHAVSGYKAIDLARHIDLYFAALTLHRASVSTIMIGTNDIKENTSLEEYKIALNQVVIKAKLLTTNANVILLTIPTFPKGIMYPYRIDMNANIAVLNAAIAEMAQHHCLRLLQLQQADADFFDGVHLNAHGNRAFAKQIADFILQDRGIQNG